MVESNGSLDDLSKSIDEQSSNRSVPEIIETTCNDVYTAWREYYDYIVIKKLPLRRIKQN